MTTSWKNKILKVQRPLGWLLVLFTILTIIAGYGLTRNLFDRNLADKLHNISAWFFISLLIFHIFVFTALIKFSWPSMIKSIIKNPKNDLAWSHILMRSTGWIILIAALLVILSGLQRYGWISDIVPFYAHVRFDIILTLAVIIHVAVGGRMALMRKNIKGKLVDIALALLAIIISIGVLGFD